MKSVSVVLNSINERADYFDLGVRSVLNQEGVEVQLILSTIENDVSIERIKDYKGDIDVVTMPANEHPGHSPLGSFMQLNNAMKALEGDYYTFAAANDIMETFKCKQETDLLGKTRKVCYSGYYEMDANGNINGGQGFYAYHPVKHRTLNFVADCSMVEVETLLKYMPFRTQFHNYAYWDLWLRIYKDLGNVFVYNPNSTWRYRQNAEAMHVRVTPQEAAQRANDRKAMLRANP